MKKKLCLDPLFLRTLGVVLLFWVLLMAVLTVNNYDRVKSSMENAREESRRYVRINAQLALEGTAAPERKKAILQSRLSSVSYYNGYALEVCRLYDENGTELARSQLARGSVVPEGTGVYSIYLQFDPVFTKEEHLAFARLLQESDQMLTDFYGYDSQAYGEVTGILDENVLYPQKLVYYYEDGPVTLMDSSHTMFDGAELTTVRFDAAYVYSSLADEELSPEKLWEMYWQADGLLDELVAEHRPSTSSGASRVGNNARATVTHYYDLPDYPMAHAYVYTPGTMAVSGLKAVYINTFLAALLAAWYISRTQNRFMQKERELTRAMAHEFKTPAAVLRAYAEALREDVSPARREEYLNTLIDEADRMGSMVNELLDLSRMNGASTAMEWEQVDLKELTQQCFERLRLPMEERGLVLNLDLEASSCIGDQKRLERAISNLALNVLHHAQPGPVTVELTANRCLTIENCCPPVQPQVLERLWEPFYKGDDSRSGEGSGLGLAIVENIVRLHGGCCFVRSTDSGIRFCISLPGQTS